ncbi:MAG: 2-phospho-L-lactate transferase [Candidatus Nanopelagicales bacterium]|nr:2-phospho-L-lactate transferase [Candidatus Nanopelagicales bacterium]
MTAPARITVLSGGIGGARFLVGLLAHLRATDPDGRGGTRTEVTVIGNTGDDIWVHGMRVCPDLDTVMYTLGGGISAERGWGREGETFTVKEELAAYGVEPTWFGLGDKDLATHLIRTQSLQSGYTLSEVTAALCDHWQPGVTLLPMSDDRAETHVVVDDPDQGRVAIHFQEWWIRHRAALPAHAFVMVGIEEARPAPGVLEAIAEADLVLLPPSNPVVSVGAILQVRGIAEALRSTPAPVVGVSPIIGGAPVRGMADACLTTIGVQTSAAAVGLHYGARTAGGYVDAWLVADTDAEALEPLRAAGIAAACAPLLMSDPETTAALAAATLALVPARWP